MVGSTGTIQNNGTLKAKSGLLTKLSMAVNLPNQQEKFSWPTQMKKKRYNYIRGCLV